MAADASAVEILKTIDRDREDVVGLCVTLGNLRDYPGEEREVAEAVAAWLDEAGIQAWLQRISEDSANAVGVLRGTGDRASGARSLILNAHIDTQGGTPSGGEEAERKIRGAWADESFLYGRGVANDKAQVAAQMIAARAIRRSGIQLKEDLYVTAVAQETSAPRGVSGAREKWSGVGPGVSQVREGHGARWLVEHGVVADYALVGEVSDFKVTVAGSWQSPWQDSCWWPCYRTFCAPRQPQANARQTRSKPPYTSRASVTRRREARVRSTFRQVTLRGSSSCAQPRAKPIGWNSSTTRATTCCNASTASPSTAATERCSR